MLQDDDVRGLIESLREMVGIAAEHSDLPLILGTTNVIEEIGHLSLQIALLIDECANSSFIGQLLLLFSGIFDMVPDSLVGRTLQSQLSDIMKSRITEYETRCRDLMGKFDRRVKIDTNKKVDRNCR